jgi:hypothetical protein
MTLEEEKLITSKNVQTDEIPIYVEETNEINVKAPKETNIFLSIFNLANAAIGMGVFSFPFTYHRTGILSGLLLTFVHPKLFINSFSVFGSLRLRDTLHFGSFWRRIWFIPRSS